MASTLEVGGVVSSFITALLDGIRSLGGDSTTRMVKSSSGPPWRSTASNKAIAKADGKTLLEWPALTCSLLFHLRSKRI